MKKSQKSKVKSQKYNLKLKIICFCFIVFPFSFFLFPFCYAQTAVSSTELIERAKELNGQEVLYEGELIGEVMTRGEYSWLNLNDGQNAIGIWAGNNFLNLISFAGDYNHKGDWLQVKGVFSRACQVHGSDLDIHAQSISLIRRGRVVRHKLVPLKPRQAIILSGVFLCLLIGQLLSRKLKKK